MTNEPKHPCPERAAPLVPSMPECDVLRYGQTVVIEGLRDYARQCAEIAQAQAQRADGAERRAEYWKAEHNAANAEIDKLHATLAQRDREVLVLREALVALRQGGSIIKCWMRRINTNGPEECKDYQGDGRCPGCLAREALAATAQAGAEAERRIREDEREKVLAHLLDEEAVQACVLMDGGDDVPPDLSWDADGLRAAILGTGGEDK